MSSGGNSAMGKVDKIRAQMELVFQLVEWVGLAVVERQKKLNQKQQISGQHNFR